MSFKDLYIPKYTYSDYTKWEGRWELIEGHPVAMSPLPVPRHQEVSLNMMIEFKNGLKRIGCKKCKVYPPIDYLIKDDTILQPDIVVVCNKIEKKFLDFPPVLVVEVLSPSTVLKDRNTKLNYYKQEGVKYYLLVDIDKEEIEILQLQDGQYSKTLYKEGFIFELNEGCNIKPDFLEIWV